jgi:hypothetical protein
MESVTNANFGPLIAYLVPGATVLVGFSQFSPVLRSWFGASPADAPSIAGFLYLTEIHYRHYQFYANEFIATAIAYACYRAKLGSLLAVGWLDLGFVLLEAIFFVTSRDTLRKYDARSRQLLASDASSSHRDAIRRRRDRHHTNHENPTPHP